MLDGKVVARSEKDGPYDWRRTDADARKLFPANQIRPVVWTSIATTSPDHYTGTLRFMSGGRQSPFTVNLDVSVRDGPLLAARGPGPRQEDPPWSARAHGDARQKLQVKLLPATPPVDKLEIADAQASECLTGRLNTIRAEIDEAALTEDAVSATWISSQVK